MSKVILISGIAGGSKSGFVKILEEMGVENLCLVTSEACYKDCPDSKLEWIEPNVFELRVEQGELLVWTQPSWGIDKAYLNEVVNSLKKKCYLELPEEEAVALRASCDKFVHVQMLDEDMLGSDTWKHDYDLGVPCGTSASFVQALDMLEKMI